MSSVTCIEEAAGKAEQIFEQIERKRGTEQNNNMQHIRNSHAIVVVATVLAAVAFANVALFA